MVRIFLSLNKTKGALFLMLAFITSIFSSAQTDVTRPVVVSVSPSNYSISFDAGISVSAVFNEAMNASTINSSTFELRNALTGALVNGTVTYNAATRTARLYPASPLTSLLYTAKVRGGTAGVKDLAGNAMASDYNWTFIMIPIFDFTAPSVLSASPSNGATSVNPSTQVSVVFSEAMNASTISASTFELRNAANVLVPAVISYNASIRKTTLIPSGPLAYSSMYKATVKGGYSGVRDQYGNPLSGNYIWSFTTSTAPDIIPPAITSVIPVGNATGVSVNTRISAVFNESMNAATINTSTVELRKGTSAALAATVTYNATTRTAILTPSSPLTGSSGYTATVKGGTAGVKDMAGNSLVNNYTWSFTTADVTPPMVLSITPANGATGIAVNTTVTALFSEPMNASTINGSTVQLLNASNTPVSAVVSYNAQTRTVTLAPTAPLANNSVYTAKIKGGSTGVKDAAGNGLAGDHTWAFKTISLTFSIFDPDILPDNPANVDQPVEVGVRFRSSINGQITGLRFYKGLGNVGTHTGHLWNNAGILLGEAIFTQETESGWQEVLFTTPVTISAGATYVASYYSSAGIYAFTNNFFTQPMVNGPLTALADGQDGANGIYKYSPSSIFPTDSYLSSNYFVDVIFSATTAQDITPPTILSVSPVNGSTDVPVNTTITGIFSEAMDAASISSSTVELRNAANTQVSASVTYNPSSNTFTLTPSVPLANSAVYSAKIKGGTAGVKDAAGNALAADYMWAFTTVDPLIAPNEGPGGPILVISSASNPFSRYAVEILRAEGLNEFAATDISTITATMLQNYDVIVLGEVPVSADKVTLLTNWVNAGGTLIAFKPGPTLNSLFGLNTATGSLADKYLLVNTASGPGAGIVNQTIQYHGTANLHTIVPGSGATSLATLYSTAATATVNPAVTMRSVGVNGGSAVAFTYDLARSVIYTRQGNPAWAGQKRDGQIDPIRSDDLFYPDWIDFNKISIPQADEQQRLLANIILQNNLHRKPLPRFWYLPRDLKAAVIMTGDDHGINGTVDRFNHFMTLGPNTALDVADWNAVRGSSYVYPATPISNGQAVSLQSQGFEIALHPNTGCLNYTFASLQNDFSTQLAQFASAYPGLKPSSTNRTHCLTWSDWASTPKVEYQNGIRLDVTYYYWPEVWMQNRPGMFTGSAMPMRFADVDGSIIDVYQAPTQMTDETNMNYTAFCNAVLDKAVGPEGYYGVFTANMHTDKTASTASADAIIASAQARQIPVISSRQMLNWLDGRSGSSFGNLNWSNNQLTFTVTARNAARNLKAMLPVNSGSGQLVSITRNGSAVAFTTQTIKGIQYAFFAVATGTHNYVADYSGNSQRVADKKTTTATNNTADQRVAAEVRADKLTAQPGGLYAKAMPNPSNGYFSLVINSSNPNPVTVRIMDMTGRVIATYQKIASSGILRLGDDWSAGNYFAEVVQNDEKKVVKLVKTN